MRWILAWRSAMYALTRSFAIGVSAFFVVALLYDGPAGTGVASDIEGGRVVLHTAALQQIVSLRGGSALLAFALCLAPMRWVLASKMRIALWFGAFLALLVAGSLEGVRTAILVVPVLATLACFVARVPAAHACARVLREAETCR